MKIWGMRGVEKVVSDNLGHHAAVVNLGSWTSERGSRAKTPAMVST